MYDLLMMGEYNCPRVGMPAHFPQMTSTNDCLIKVFIVNCQALVAKSRLKLNLYVCIIAYI